MSLPELLTAVKTTLTTYLVNLSVPGIVADRTVVVCKDGQPPLQLTSFKDYFIGISGLNWQPGETNDANPGLHEELSFQIVVTKKITFVPDTKIPTVTWDSTRGIYKLVRLCLLCVHDSWNVITAVNALVSGRDFITTPKWLGSDSEPEHVGPEWLGVQSQNQSGTDCLVVRSRFGKVERIQCSTADGETVN